jgi:hypothetical protein
MPDDLSFSLVHIDCDLYVPIVHALNYFYPRLAPGGYLIVHDYASLDWEGAEKAVDEFFADKPESVIPLTDGCGSVAIRRSRSATGSGNWLMQRRCAKFSDQWVSASKGGLMNILGNGWSGPEPWGVWGVGPSHTLDLYMERPPAGDATVEIECATALVGPRKSQQVDVFAAGRLLATWEFSLKSNQGRRSVTVPVDTIGVGDWEFPVIRLEFRPREVAPITELDPARNDTRPLGLALVAIRRGDPA